MIALNITAQPTSVNYEKNDFVLLVLQNPTLSLCNFKDYGINSRNTEIDTEEFFLSRKSDTFHQLMIKAVGKDTPAARKEMYRKCAAAWRVFLEIQNSQACIHRNPRNLAMPRIDEVMRHKLSIVPLKLTKY